jgi:hypothetical protein
MNRSTLQLEDAVPFLAEAFCTKFTLWSQLYGMTRPTNIHPVAHVHIYISAMQVVVHCCLARYTFTLYLFGLISDDISRHQSTEVPRSRYDQWNYLSTLMPKTPQQQNTLCFDSNKASYDYYLITT